MQSCQSLPNLYAIPNGTNCYQCHSECKDCSGPDATDCFECKNIKFDNYCLAKCPDSKYAVNEMCFDCHEACTSCTGPRDNLGENGCTTCEKAIINGNKVKRCLKKDENCPGDYPFINSLVFLI